MEINLTYVLPMLYFEPKRGGGLVVKVGLMLRLYGVPIWYTVECPINNALSKGLDC